MQKLLYILFVIALISVSCKKNTLKTDNQQQKDTIVVQNKRNINSIGYVLTPEAQEYVKDWEELQKFDAFITKYFAISNSDALQNAKELSELAFDLKDSNRFELLQDPSVAARLNILDTECKRLADMATITAIKPEEVSAQIKKILEAYSAVNSKFNSVLEIKDLESEIHLDPDFLAILSDVPEADEEEVPTTKTNNTIQKTNPQNNLNQKKILNKKKIQDLHNQKNSLRENEYKPE